MFRLFLQLVTKEYQNDVSCDALKRCFQAIVVFFSPSSSPFLWKCKYYLRTIKKQAHLLSKHFLSTLLSFALHFFLSLSKSWCWIRHISRRCECPRNRIEHKTSTNKCTYVHTFSMHFLDSFSIQFCSPSWRSTLPFVPIVTFAYTVLLWIERIERKYTEIRVIVHAVSIIRTEIQLNPNTHTKRERQIYAQCTFMPWVYKNL